jgi:hypothetical protein
MFPVVNPESKGIVAAKQTGMTNKKKECRLKSPKSMA